MTSADHFQPPASPVYWQDGLHHVEARMRQALHVERPIKALGPASITHAAVIHWGLQHLALCDATVGHLPCAFGAQPLAFSAQPRGLFNTFSPTEVVA